MPTAVPIFVISRNRALYLWASLDSLYKYTKYPHHFVFGDNGSDEPLVHQVIEGFSRRGMFSRTLLREENDPDLLEILLEQNQDLLGSYFVFVESDVMVFPQDPCWLTRFVQLMDADPALAMLGAFIDQTDFVDPARARELASELSESQLEFLIKAKSPERNLSKAGKKVITPDSTCPNPPGRLVIYRTEIIQRLFNLKVRHLTDSSWHKAIVTAGYKTGIATDVCHRHLSLLNFYDYPAYSEQTRDWYFRRRPREYAGDHGSGV